ncbi:MAG: hypothetical protein HQ541_09550 [Mariniphaga sp.]|nr:hypothetical protein [Mariniphaga sp.]
MVISNKKKATALKRLFFLTGLVMAIFMLVMFLRDENLIAILTGAAFIVWFFIFQLFDFQYIEFIIEDDKIVLRYYPAVKFGKKEYNSIEFANNLLHDVQFESTFFGLVTDLVLIVKTKRGIAEYPSISLTAVNSNDRKKIKESLYKILEK